jgi:hypothetical protein
VTSVSDELPVLLFLALIVTIGLARSIRIARGTPASPIRLASYAGIWLFLFLLVAIAGVAPLPIWYLGVEAALAIGAGIFAAYYVRGVAEIFHNDAGVLSYRLGFALPAVYLALLVVRLSVDLAVLGEDPFAQPPVTAPASVTLVTLALVALVDALFAFSTGLLVGRSAGVYWALKDHEKKETAARSGSPLP